MFALFAFASLPNTACHFHSQHSRLFDYWCIINTDNKCRMETASCDRLLRRFHYILNIQQRGNGHASKRRHDASSLLCCSFRNPRYPRSLCWSMARKQTLNPNTTYKKTQNFPMFEASVSNPQTQKPNNLIHPMNRISLFLFAAIISLSSFAASNDKALPLRLLNHWDNLNGTVERGYAGRSIFWNNAMNYDYEKYARELESEGINGTVLNNVNASPKILTTEYLDSVKVFAEIFRPHGIKVYLSVNFASPKVIGGLNTADPLDKNVQKWWKNKAKEIYKKIPDFGGFLVKANSEGEPGPMDYGRSHADGANMLADALKPYKGIVMWRAFVYSQNDPDRAKQAYIEFKHLDGQFRDNVIIQIKNGPIDFQPREPISPLFYALPNTKVMAEFQITQEYLGHANHVNYLAPMWKEMLDDMYRYGSNINYVGAAGVSNRGNDPKANHIVADLNEYAFGVLAANPKADCRQIVNNWMQDRFGYSGPETQEFVDMLMMSREATVNFMMPLGLHHLFAWGHHYGPEPWCKIEGGRPDWMPSYYHRADAEGLGFNRSSTGSNATEQYPEALGKKLDSRATCPDELVLWFHHVGWNDKLHSGRTLWNELCYRYQHGVDMVRQMQVKWAAFQDMALMAEAADYIPKGTYGDIKNRLAIEEHDAIWWRDACVQYFQTFSKQPIPDFCEKPQRSLDELKKFKLNIDNYTNAQPY